MPFQKMWERASRWVIEWPWKLKPMKSVENWKIPSACFTSFHRSPLLDMKCMKPCCPPSGRRVLLTGRAQVTVTPSSTVARACLRFSGVMRLTVPSSSSSPQRPQLLSLSK